jgi:hypothetical protein
MEAGATTVGVASAFISSRKTFSTVLGGMSNDMEARATTDGARASMPFEESYSAGLEAGATNPSNAPASRPVEDGIPSRDLPEASTAASIDARKDDSSLAPNAADTNDDPWSYLNGPRELDGLVLDLPDGSVGLDEAIPPDDPVACEELLPYMSFDTNTAVESAQQPPLSHSQKVELLRTKVKFLPEEHFDKLARSMGNNPDDKDWALVCIRNRIWSYLDRLYGHDSLWPNTLEPLHKWLLSSVQPMIPTTCIIRNETKVNVGKKRGNPSFIENQKTKRQRYRCPLCGEIKVRYTEDGTPIPHLCPKRPKDKGTEMGTEIGGSDNDIDRILANPPDEYPIRYAHRPSVLDRTGGEIGDGDGDSAGDRKPAAAAAAPAAADDGDRKPPAIVRRSETDFLAPSPARCPPRTARTEQGLFQVSEELSITTQAPIETEESPSRQQVRACRAPFSSREIAP